MFPGFRIGTLFGFPIGVHLSFLLLLGVVLLWMGGIAGSLLVLMVAGSVLVHELGHALLARHLGVPVAGIGLERRVLYAPSDMRPQDLRFYVPATPEEELALARTRVRERREGLKVATALFGGSALAGAAFAIAAHLSVGAAQLLLAGTHPHRPSQRCAGHRQRVVLDSAGPP